MSSCSLGRRCTAVAIHARSPFSRTCDIAAFGGSAYALFDGLAEQLAGGTGEFVGRLAADGGEVVLSSPVHRVEQRDAAVRVITREGNVYEGGAVVLAVPINVLAAVELDPPPDRRIVAAALAGQPCRSRR